MSCNDDCNGRIQDKRQGVGGRIPWLHCNNAVQKTAYAAGQTQIWGGKLLSGFISCGISDFGGGLAKFMLRVKRADGSTFHSDAIREKLRGSDVALDGSVVHTVGKVFKNSSAYFTFWLWYCKRFWLCKEIVLVRGIFLIFLFLVLIFLALVLYLHVNSQFAVFYLLEQ